MDRVTANRLYEMATNHRNNGKGLTAVSVYSKALELYKRVGDMAAVADCQHMIGVSYKVENDIAAAVDNLHKAAELYAELGNAVRLAAVHRDIGLTYMYAGKHQEARPWLERSVNELANQSFEEAQNELAISQAKMGHHYLRVGDLGKADDWLDAALETIRQSDHWFYEMTILLHVAELQIGQEHFSNALTSLWAALGLVMDARESAKQKRRIAQIKGMMASCYLAMDNPARSVRMMNSAMATLSGMAKNVASVVLADISASKYLSDLQKSYPGHYYRLIERFPRSRFR